MPLTNVKVGDVYQTRDRTKIVRVLATDRKTTGGFTLVGAISIKAAITPNEYLRCWLSDGCVDADCRQDDDRIPLDEVIHTLWFKDAKWGWRTWGMVNEARTPDVEKELASLKQALRYTAGMMVQTHVTKATFPSEPSK